MSYNNPRSEKSYNGTLMAKGKLNEDIILAWLREHDRSKEVLDFREFRLAQRIDVDFGIETIDGGIVLAEVKSDDYLGKTGNIFLELFRINHFVKPEHHFYLGWFYRTPALKLIVRNPESGLTYIIRFDALRNCFAHWVEQSPREITNRLVAVSTDKQKTTYGIKFPSEKVMEHTTIEYIKPRQSSLL